jgi:CheY-like chemotaxis protein
VLDRRSHRVLVIDDNEDIRTALGWGLESLGYTVRTAADGLTGLEVAVEFRPHSALIDISLPTIDGWELAERFSSHPVFKRPRLIALTGLSSDDHRAKSAASGFDFHIVKPVRLAKLDALLSC